MAESTSAERLDYLLEMALTIHEGIVEHVEGDDELDKQLIAHLKELDHFIVVKKALQGRYVNQPCSSDDELAAGGSTPPPSHQAPLTAAHAKKHSISPQSQHSPPSPSLSFLRPSHKAPELRHLHDEKVLAGSREKRKVPRLCARCGMQYPMQAGLTSPNERRGWRSDSRRYCIKL
ncbi:uncharacterized protein FFUJ_12785 [Fusarium fujikuroi IMI 58289]|uniref:Uncharacterized protein n=2 Tax=Fusarium fujikuroi TaxID=5127 RepID=S0EL48_GIBF5|nr:uncharacterized protein FFUJ_12785 [Fusarium fujikuroi IMI 58289]KLP12005.1 uncharacterized protein Y057_8565 [Fusarium fujikuroi]KLP21485.1 uncharacterized protein LW94_996 [Fusarium fujikuroi]CCT73098.1 uncharacterized protein FFUJ_12785 [Fusarium fujikuroi IMI 58289]SCO19576.1 uncharacterized protein FFE2_14362 [Fusarium fujikuroi]SCO25008.1 uncharacterized protein FFM5_13916 [Fusarium fujikuroi]